MKMRKFSEQENANTSYGVLPVALPLRSLPEQSLKPGMVQICGDRLEMAA